MNAQTRTHVESPETGFDDGLTLNAAFTFPSFINLGWQATQLTVLVLHFHFCEGVGGTGWCHVTSAD